MTLIDLTIKKRGFALSSIALSVRTIGCCYAMRHQPDTRLVTGIGVLGVEPDSSNGGFRFDAKAACLGEGQTPSDLLDWLEMRLPGDGAIISWHNFGSVPRRLRALANADRHPRLLAAAADLKGQWRDLPRGHSWHVRQARASAMPCLCGPGATISECRPITPAALLPDPQLTANQLIEEAIAGWQCWARDFCAFDDTGHPAQVALRGLRDWRKSQSHAAGA